MELSERCIATLEKEGWLHVSERQDKPGTVHTERPYNGNVALYVTDGSIEATVGGIVQRLSTCDRIDIPPQVPYSAIVGPTGVQLVVGEEIEGDF